MASHISFMRIIALVFAVLVTLWIVFVARKFPQSQAQHEQQDPVDYKLIAERQPNDDVARRIGADKKPLFIGVLTDPVSLRTIGMAAYTTWTRDIEHYATVVFFIGSCQNKLDLFPGNLVCLDTPDIYPPQEKVFKLWKYVFTEKLSQFRWFMKVDHDSYVNTPLLINMILELDSGPKRFRPTYIGLPATGRPEEREKLGLDGRTYCSGLGYIMNDLALSRIGGRLDHCLKNAVSTHSDTEVGRCVSFNAFVQCETVNGFMFKQVYYQQDGSMVYPMTLIEGGQMALMFPREPKATHFGAVVVHPLKRTEDFYRFHKQTTSFLRPIQPLISKRSFQLSYQQANADLRTTCVNNIARQLEVHKYPLKECDSPVAEEDPDTLPDVYILPRSNNFESLQNQLTSLDISVLLAEGSDQLQALRNIFRNATLADKKSIMIINDDVSLICNFRERLHSLLHNARCGGHLFTERQGGVLILGVTEVGPKAMDMIERDRSIGFARSRNGALCYNINSQTTDILGAIIHRSVYGDLLSFLKTLSQQKHASVSSFNNVFTRLADKGVIVRAAFPNLLVPRLVEEKLQKMKKHSLKDAAVMSKWYESSYCDENGEPIDVMPYLGLE